MSYTCIFKTVSDHVKPLKYKQKKSLAEYVWKKQTLQQVQKGRMVKSAYNIPYIYNTIN